jgi:hypothetical protein
MPKTNTDNLTPLAQSDHDEPTLDEIEEMKHNFFGFMSLLTEIDKDQKQQKEGSND